MVIAFQFQCPHLPVGFGNFIDSHRYGLRCPVQKCQTVIKPYLGIFQSVAVDLRKQADSHFCCIHCSEFYLRVTAALPFYVAGTLHDILCREFMYLSGFCRDRTVPLIFSCILPYGIFEFL